jgi:hypothetical protein
MHTQVKAPVSKLLCPGRNEIRTTPTQHRPVLRPRPRPIVPELSWAQGHLALAPSSEASELRPQILVPFPLIGVIDRPLRGDA